MVDTNEIIIILFLYVYACAKMQNCSFGVGDGVGAWQLQKR